MTDLETIVANQGQLIEELQRRLYGAGTPPTPVAPYDPLARAGLIGEDAESLRAYAKVGGVAPVRPFVPHVDPQAMVPASKSVARGIGWIDTPEEQRRLARAMREGREGSR